MKGTPTWRAKQDVLARLRHRAVGRRHHQDRAVHLGRAGDHVLHVVGVARAVDMGVVALLGRRIFHVARRNRQDLGRIAPALALGRLRHLVIGHKRRRSSPCPPTPSSAPPSASSCRDRRDRSSPTLQCGLLLRSNFAFAIFQ